MTFNAVYLYALVQNVLTGCGAALEAELALDARHGADRARARVRSTILEWLRALRSGDEAAAFRPEVFGRVLDALHAHSVASVDFGGAGRTQFTGELAPASRLASEMAVEIAREIDANTGSEIVSGFRRRQREQMLQFLALELDGQMIGDAWRVRLV